MPVWVGWTSLVVAGVAVGGVKGVADVVKSLWWVVRFPGALSNTVA